MRRFRAVSTAEGTRGGRSAPGSQPAAHLASAPAPEHAPPVTGSESPGARFDFSRIATVPSARQVGVQARLVVGRTDDPLEAEADRVAEAVLGMPAPAAKGGGASEASSSPAVPGAVHVSRKCSACEAHPEEEVQRSPSSSGVPDILRSPEDEDGPVAPEHAGPVAMAVAPAAGDSEDIPTPVDEDEAVVAPGPIQTKRADGAAPTRASGLESLLQATRGGGQPLPASERGYFEPRFGFDFSRVNIHTDSTADALNRQLNARAFTTGHDIYFRQGEYSAESAGSRRLLAHELTHVVQQRGGAQAVQRQPGGEKKPVYHRYQVRVPESYTTVEQMYRLFERTVYGKELNLSWSCGGYCDMAKNRGQVIPFRVHAGELEANTDPAVKKSREEHKTAYGKLTGTKKKAVGDEANKRYYERSGDKPGTQIKKGETGKTRMWDQALDEVLKDAEALDKLPPEMKELMTGKGGSFQPKDYQHLLRIAEKLKQFAPEDFAVYKLLAIRATDNLELFEKSVDMFLARKEELKKALEAQPQAATPEPTLKDAIDAKWKGLDEAAVGKMSEGDRYDLARQKTSELTAAQLQYMKEHPGETLKDFAKAATLMNTGETFSAIGKDLTEAAKGDANSWARWAAGTGAGAKLSGWMLAVAGVLYVASWLTGIGELATIAAAAGILLGSTLTLSLAESELRIKAASQAKTPEEFKRHVEAAAAARTNVVVGVALIVVAAVLHFTAKAYFPNQVLALKTSLKNFRERVRLKGSVHELKPGVVKELTAHKGELLKSAETAKKSALDAAKEMEGLSTEQFVERLEKGDGGFLDQAKVPPEQKVNFRELLGTPEGRKAIEGYKARLVNALKTDVLAQIDRLAQEYISKIDEFVKEIEGAKNHDELGTTADKLEKALSEERAKEFMKGEQEKLTQKKLEEAATEAQQEVVTAVREGIVKRLRQRIAAQADKFQLTYTEAELQALFKKGRELGLSDGLIEDMLYTGSRVAKAISAADLMKQMENWANVVNKQGFPYKFADLAEFQQFSRALLAAVKEAGLPTSDVRVQGSSLRKPTADDVDLAVFVDEATFDKLLVDRFDGRAAFSETAPSTPKAKLSLKNQSHADLVKLADDIQAHDTHYNNQAQTFANAIKTGIINSKSDIIKPLKAAKTAVATKYPQLNIQTISVLIKGGAFDVKPDMPIKGN